MVRQGTSATPSAASSGGVPEAVAGTAAGAAAGGLPRPGAIPYATETEGESRCSCRAVGWLPQGNRPSGVAAWHGIALYLAPAALLLPLAHPPAPCRSPPPPAGCGTTWVPGPRRPTRWTGCCWSRRRRRRAPRRLAPATSQTPRRSACCVPWRTRRPPAWTPSRRRPRASRRRCPAAARRRSARSASRSRRRCGSWRRAARTRPTAWRSTWPRGGGCGVGPAAAEAPCSTSTWHRARRRWLHRKRMEACGNSLAQQATLPCCPDPSQCDQPGRRTCRSARLAAAGGGSGGAGQPARRRQPHAQLLPTAAAGVG